MQELKTGFVLDDPRFPKRRFWTFKHKPGINGASEARKIVKWAYHTNACLMQYEYGCQDQGMVTQNWNAVAEVKNGDVIFLRGDTRIHAVGVVIKHGFSENDDEYDITTTSIKRTVTARQHGDGNVLCSNQYEGIVIFSDSDVFYEDLTDGPGEWGQRINVDKWRYFIDDGVDCQSTDFYTGNGSVFAVLRELKKECAKDFVDKLFVRYCFQKGIDPMVVDILEKNMNVVLTGAPGTGKTYLAREIAKELTSGINDHVLNVQFHPSYGYSDFVEGLRPVKKGDTLGFQREDGVFMDICRKAIEHPNDKYVVIIDEINRGDISKIFGELFSLIEKDYRTFDGEADGKVVSVKTQYNNLMEDNVFKNGFFVPPNIYIIGTMNDVDRSVESMDFAIRRRFVWHEVKPMDRFDAIWGNEDKNIDREDVKRHMNELNKVICQELGEAYQVGPSYFKKLQNLQGDYGSLWNEYLKILLKEYVRGMSPNDQNRLLGKFAECLGLPSEAAHV